jgi:hypothetical protein
MVVFRIPNLNPRVDPSTGATPGFEAQRVVPQQNLAPDQNAQLAQAGQQAGLGLQRVGDFLQDERDDANSRTLSNEFAEQAREIKRRYGSMLGKNAVENREKVLEELANLRESFAERPENENQHKIFSARADVYQFDTEDAIEGWAAQQTKAFNIGALKATEQGGLVDYQDNWQNPEKAATYKASVLDAVNKRGSMEGWSDEQRRIEVLKTTTEMHAGVLQPLIEQSPTRAAEYLQANHAEIAPAVQNELAKRLQQSTEKVAAFRMATDPAIANLPLADKLKALGAKADESNFEIVNRAQRQVFDDYVMEQRAKDAQEGEMLQAAFTKVAANQGLDPNTLFSADEKVKLQNGGLWDDVEARAANNGVDKPFGIELYALALDRPDLLRGQSWGALQKALAPVLDLNGRRMATIQAAWAEANRPPDKAPNPQHTEVLSKEQFYLRMAEEAGVITRESRNDRDEKTIQASTEYLQFADNLERDIARIEVGGKKATRVEIREIVEGYKKFATDSKKLLPTLSKEEAINESVTFKGQRVAISEVLTPQTEQNPERAVLPWVRNLVIEWNRGQPGEQPLNPSSPTDAAKVLAATRAVELDRERARQPEREKQIAGQRWRQLQQARQREERIRDLLARKVPAGDPAWSAVADGPAPEVSGVDALRTIDEVISQEWQGGSNWWNDYFGFSRSRHAVYRLDAEKRITDELRKRKIPFEIEDIRGRMK